MRRCDDDPSACEMCLHQRDEAREARRIERDRRFVEEPQGPRRDEQPRERQPPSLSGRQIGDRKIGEGREVEGIERRLRIVAADIEGYEIFLMRTLLAHPTVATASSHFALSVVKYSTALPL